MATRRRIARLPRARFPVAAEQRYERELTNLVRRELSGKIGELVARWTRLTTNDAKSSTRKREYVTGPNELDQVIEGIGVSLSAAVERTSWLNEAGNLCAKGNGEAIVEQLRGVAVVRPLASQPWLAPLLDVWRANNVALIGRLGDAARERLSATIGDAWDSGASIADLERRLGEDADIVGRRARLIARDQVGKLNGQLTMLRQSALGIEHYVWQTTMDERVRQTHADRHGERFAWAEPPPDGHPGTPIQCRCTAAPDIDDALDALEAEGRSVATMPDGTLILEEGPPPAATARAAAEALGPLAPPDRVYAVEAAVRAAATVSSSAPETKAGRAPRAPTRQPRSSERTPRKTT